MVTIMNAKFIIGLSAAALLLGGCAKLKDDLPQPIEPGVQVHHPSWMDTTSANFHGTLLRTGGAQVQTCFVCHGGDYNGGTSGVSCISCHNSRGANIHGRGWEDPSSSNFHGRVIAAGGWDMRPCQPCHGTRYTGGSTPVPCTTCHNEPGGPENCSTCHGSINPAPPRDLSRNTARSARGVGAHQPHVVGTSLAAPMFCHQCHNVPGEIYAAGHIDQTPNAEVVMNELARTVTNEPSTNTYSPTLPLFSPTPTYDASSLSCSSTYCHGNFKNGNTNYAPSWTDTTGAASACGTCHGDVSRPTLAEKALPKTAAQGGTHPNVLTCSQCHAGIVDANARIIDPVRHVNGKLNAFGLEWDF